MLPFSRIFLSWKHMSVGETGKLSLPRGEASSYPPSPLPCQTAAAHAWPAGAKPRWQPSHQGQRARLWACKRWAQESVLNSMPQGALAGSGLSGSIVPTSLDSAIVRNLEGQAEGHSVPSCPRPANLDTHTVPFRQIRLNTTLKPRPTVKSGSPGTRPLSLNPGSSITIEAAAGLPASHSVSLGLICFILGPWWLRHPPPGVAVNRAH